VHIAQLVPFLLPNALLYAVPGTILFAVSMVYGRMSGSNEIVAIKAMGISPMVLLWPTLFMAVVLSFVTVWLNDVATSWGYQGVQSVVINALEDIAYSMLRTTKSFSSKTFSVNVKRVDGRKLIHPTFTFRASEDDPMITITAEEAELRSNPGSGMLTVICRNGTVDAGGMTFDFPDTFERDIPLDAASKKGGSSESPSHMPLRALPARVAQQRLAIERFEQEQAAQAAYQMLTGDLGRLTGSQWAVNAVLMQGKWNQLYRLQTETPRRWANGFSCLCFSLVGAAVAIRFRNSDVLSTFGICFGPILVVYYPLLAHAVDRSKAGAYPPVSVWLANVVLIACGLWVLRKVVRY
jgi:lipopolysaccharide export system permease protein